jgi:hypothetical protein
MSSEYYAGLMIGFRVNIKQIEKVFGYNTPGKFHMENRYNPRTGRKMKAEKVWDKGSEFIFVLDGKECYDEEFFWRLAKKLHVFINTEEVYFGDKVTVYFGPKSCKEEHSREANGGYSLEQLFSLKEEFNRIKKALRMYGLNPGGPAVFLSGYYN